MSPPQHLRDPSHGLPGEKDTMVHVKSSDISWIMTPGDGYVGMTVQEVKEGVVLFGNTFQPLVPIAEVIRKVPLCSPFTYLYWENQRYKWKKKQGTATSWMQSSVLSLMLSETQRTQTNVSGLSQSEGVSRYNLLCLIFLLL